MKTLPAGVFKRAGKTLRQERAFHGKPGRLFEPATKSQLLKVADNFGL